jgi:OFA family oxalate/formate antiporter-like MFS transporter
MKTPNRWTVAIAGVFLQIALGAVYAWSVFRDPLIAQFGWSISEVTRTFTISIFVLGFAAFFGGLWMNRKGPRIVAVTGAILYGLGVFLASFSANKLWWLYLSYGFIGGLGLGFGYIVPVATLVKWFPDRRGLITGIAVGGFGAGALITAPVATRLIVAVGVLPTFAYLGIGYFVIALVASLFMQNPPDGWRLEGWTPSATQTAQRATHDYVLSEALKTWQWWALWLILFLNTCAGISVISQEQPIFKQITGATVAVASGMVGIVSLGNGVGRVFWAWISDLVTRRVTFGIMFLIQVLLFWLLPTLTATSIMTAVTFVILMCYGGGFGTMPAFAADYFGSKNVGPIYGLMLTAWSFASVFGPLYIARMREMTGHYSGALHVIAGVMVASILLPILVRPPRKAEKSTA